MRPPVLPSNDLRISCGPSGRRPHKPTLPPEGAARAGPGATPARRLHARVRRRGAPNFRCRPIDSAGSAARVMPPHNVSGQRGAAAA